MLNLTCLFKGHNLADRRRKEPKTNIKIENPLLIPLGVIIETYCARCGGVDDGLHFDFWSWWNFRVYPVLCRLRWKIQGYFSNRK
jgi:hypothetical protein